MNDLHTIKCSGVLGHRTHLDRVPAVSTTRTAGRGGGGGGSTIVVESGHHLCLQRHCMLGEVTRSVDGGVEHEPNNHIAKISMPESCETT